LLENLLSLNRLAAIAHRGGSALRPENTIAAFDHARDLGVDAVECDVHLSRDDEVVVIHDPTLDRTTDATGPVEAKTAAELARVDAAFRFNPGDGSPYRGRSLGVPRLRDLLDRYREMPFVIEIKGTNPRTAERTAAVVEAAGATGRVLIGGFNHEVLEAVRRIQPDVPTSASLVEARQALWRSRFGFKPRAAGFRLFQMPFRLQGRQMFRQSFVRAARRGGLPVQAWIVDDPYDMRRLIRWGVTGIISDRPDLALGTIEELRIEKLRSRIKN
jgi:glycerophosphoryl diester phosphodiesterase